MDKDDLFHFSEDLEGIGAGFDKQLKQSENEKTKQALKKARVLCICEDFDQALKIYKGITAEDFECIPAYIGILRVHSKDFTVYEGEEIEKDIKVINKLGDGSEADDIEYVDYLKKRKEYLAKKPAQPAKPAIPDGILSKAEAKKLYGKKEYKKALPSLLYYAENDVSPDGELYYMLGDCYYQGDYSDDWGEKSVYWLKKGVELGNAAAQALLGSYYYNGEAGLNEDNEKAVYLLTKAAEQGNATAQVYLGDCYAFGQGVAKDRNKAIYWYEKAAAQGDKDAQNGLKWLKNKK